MFNQRAKILQIAVVSIMCLVLTSGVGAQSGPQTGEFNVTVRGSSTDWN